jgi:hypothetical protein
VSDILTQTRAALRARHSSRRSDQCHRQWVRRYISYHGLRHPAELAEPEINAFVTHLADVDRVSASTIFTQVRSPGGQGVRSPLDAL